MSDVSPVPAFVKRLILAICFVLLCSLTVTAAERLTLNFNPDWKFIKSDPAGASALAFDDKKWINVSAPHTYNDIDTFDNWSIAGHQGEQNQWSGRTWYRKTFTVPETFKGRKVTIEFEAVRQVAEVYINGKLLGISRNGFAPFGFDLTPYLRFGQPNVIAVMCDNRFLKDTAGKIDEIQAKANAAIPAEVEQIQADQIPWNNPHWHPAHGGIYRNVRLYVTDPLHISLPLYSYLQTAGPYVYSTEISEKSATVNVEVPVENGRKSEEQVEIGVQILNHDGKPMFIDQLGGVLKIAAGAAGKSTLSFVIPNPQLWQPDYPYLYRAVCTISVGGKPVDSQEIPFGIRTVRWDTNTGFYINGQHLKLHGWGQKPTDEWPGLGAAQPDWLHFYTLNLMKAAGGNWLRWGHCLAGRGQIEASDRLGILVEQPGVDGESDTVGAAWKIRTAAFRDTIIYFRNNPSIVIWEGGNQKVTREHAAELRGYMDTYDPQGGRAYAHRRADQVTAEFMTVGIGTEGGREIKELPVVEGEYNREESPRRVWDDKSPPNFGYKEGKGQTYDLTSEEFAVNQVGHYVKKLGAENHAGGANWLFTDSTSGGRVTSEVARTSGEVDGVRLPKEAYYVCQAMFRADPQVHIIGHWTYPAGTKKAIYVASNCQEVELFLNGKSLGHGQVSNQYLFTFPDVVWAAGEIKAVGTIGGKQVASQSKHTVGPAVALKLVSITGPGGLQADGADVALIDVEAVDAKGEICPTFQERVDFETTGPGIWRGGYNSGKINSTNNTWLDLECGINRVAVRSTRSAGAITVRAKSVGLQPGSVSIPSLPVQVTNGFSGSLPAMPVVAITKQPVASMAVSQVKVATNAQTQAGRFISDFSYSGPTSGVQVEPDAQDGKKIYSDRDYLFDKLPVELKGADYVLTANADKLYNAVDLMQIAVKSGSVVFVVHDDRLKRPNWLATQFKPTDLNLTIDGQPMKIFQHQTTGDESLTLGTNTEDAAAKSCNMYLVFVK